MNTASQRMTAPVLRHVRARVPLLLLSSCLVAALAVSRSGAAFADAERSLASWLSEQGLTLVPGQVRWLEGEQGPLRLRSALVLAHRGSELDDVYYVEARQSQGAVLDAWWLTNLTRSSSAAERGLTQIGTHVAYAVGLGDTTDAVVVLDARGEPQRLTREWPWYAKSQNAITNFQQTGRRQGFDRRDYRLAVPAREFTLRAKDDRFVVRADGVRIAIDPRRVKPVEGAALVRVQSLEKGQPGTITWLVDSVRNLPFVGAEPIAWLEHVVFGVSDRVRRAYHSWTGGTGNAHMGEALAVQPAAAASSQASHARQPTPVADGLLSASEPALDWPPQALQPILDLSVRGEGKWLPVTDDPFVNAYPNAPPAFYQTFIRVDSERPYLSVYVTLWDPRQVQLHIAMGTAEPQSATGETGAGLVPRDPALLSRLVGGFNGGFQALHGEFGMMADGRVYLPPKPWAATVAVYSDGRVGMGSWRGPGRSGWDEARANAQIPPDMIAMRQNLTSVVEDGRINPWKRWWWGAAPLNAEEQTYIARSGLCLTQEGHLAFLWGETMGPDELAKAMLAVRCARGLHLDMNTKHTGFEFYRPLPASQQRPSLGRALGEFEFEGPIEGGHGIDFRSRLAVTTMAPLRFPRYLARDPRDFFFLTLKSVLPGPEVTIGGRAVAFSSAGLPHAGWPHAFARARLAARPASEEGDTWLVRIDLARALPGPLAPPELGQPLAQLRGVDPTVQAGAVALYTTQQRGFLRYAIGVPPNQARIVMRGSALEAGAPAARALGIDREGFLIYAEAPTGNSSALSTLLRDAGVEAALRLPDGAHLAFSTAGGFVAADGQRKLPSEGQGLTFVAETRPAAQVIFGDVKPTPYAHWGWLQGQRVRYFPSGPPRFPTPEAALAPRAPATATPAPSAPVPP